jgi:hypothetical protein
MTIHFIFALAYVSILVWAVMTNADTFAVVLVLVLIQVAASLSYAITFNRYEKIFIWFKRNVHITRHTLPLDAPDDLINEEDDIDD